MKIKFLFAAVLAFPAVASAVVNIHLERIGAFPGETVTVEVFGENPDVAENERLNAFTIALNAPTFGPPGGDRPWFVVPPDGVFAEPTAHPYIFGDFPGNPPTDPAQLSDYQTVFLSAALGGAGQEADLTGTRNGFAKVSIFVPDDVLPGFYPVSIDPDFLALGSAGATLIAVPLDVGGIIFIPEPTAAALFTVAGVLAIRRRRRSCGRRRAGPAGHPPAAAPLRRLSATPTCVPSGST